MFLFSTWQDKTPLRPGGNRHPLKNSAKQTLSMKKYYENSAPSKNLSEPSSPLEKNKEIEIPPLDSRKQ